MTKYLLLRFVNYLVLTAIAASMAYILASISLNPRSNFDNRQPRPPEYAIDHQLDAYNLNPKTPVLIRYERWAGGVLHGDFGMTVQGTPVGPEMGRRILLSTRLLLIATILGSILGALAGVWGAVRQYRLSDRLTTLGSFLLLSMPAFVTATALQILAVDINQISGQQIFQYVGPSDPGASGFLNVLLSSAQHLVLPTIALTLAGIALFSRYQRNTMLDVLGSDFLRTARAKGLRRGEAILKHGLRTAIIPVMTLFVYNILLLFTGVVFTETIFGWHGMGEWLVTSVQSNDVNAVAAIATFTAILVLIAGMLSDILYAALDPRVRIR